MVNFYVELADGSFAAFTSSYHVMREQISHFEARQPRQERGLHSFLSPLIATRGKLRGEFGGGESGANDDQATRLWALLLTRSSGQ
jgi:hypothetical protein